MDRLLAIVLLCALLLPACAIAQHRPVEYTLTLDQPQTQMIDVTMLLRDVDQPHVDAMLPVWRPGRYAILDSAGAVRDVRADDGSGRELAVRKADKSTWRIDSSGASTVRLRYRVYCNEISLRTRHVDDTHAFISPSAVIMYTAERREHPLRVTVEAPEGWDIATGLSPDPEQPSAVIAPNYDVLVDSPLEIGLHDLIEFDVDGVPHEIVIWGQGDWDSQKLIDDFTKIIRAQRDIFGRFPYDRYVFLVHCRPGGGGGTEHLNSTIMGTSPAAFENDDRYHGFLGLVAHEYFHTWNVKQLRPAGIHPYDYQRENYTDLLWVAEGMTSYYDDLTMARTGQTPQRGYLDTLRSSIRGYMDSPARHVQSLAASSFDAWIIFNKSSPDSVNTSVNFYRDGALASLCLDMEVRRRTNNLVSLDDVMRRMFERFPLSGPGYTTRDLIGVINEMTASDISDFFSLHIDGTQTLPLESALDVVGLELSRDDDGEPGPFLGMDVSTSGGLAEVTRVRADGPAYSAGFNAGDQVIAVNGERLSGGLDGVIDDLEPGDEVTFLAFRNDRVREVRVTLAERPPGDWTLRKLDDPTPEQKAAYASWIGHPWDRSSAPDDESDG